MGVRKSTSWRQLTGSSPHTVRVTDEEFLAEITHTDGANVTYFHKIIPRVLLATAVRRFDISEANPETATFNGIIYLNANLNAAGTELTTSLTDRGINDAGLARFAVVNVYAR